MCTAAPGTGIRHQLRGAAAQPAAGPVRHAGAVGKLERANNHVLLGSLSRSSDPSTVHLCAVRTLLLILCAISRV